MTTTILWSVGNSRFKLFELRPGASALVPRQYRGGTTPLTPTLISAQDPSAEYLPIRINRFTDRIRIRPSTHRIHVHLV
jgi:hypothetical protein